ncbi:MAG: hypothetical protein QOG22_3757 [Pseudonocardiales bacterium]|jgi:hypothetical protein|nr:hypothetical protein [Pseudonocardiales bacterium]MDT4979540.1 hypothetical protein [Pseudonocardiales bacterium]
MRAFRLLTNGTGADDKSAAAAGDEDEENVAVAPMCIGATAVVLMPSG